MPSLFIHLATLTPRSATTGAATPSPSAILGNAFSLVVGFVTNGAVVALEEGTTGKLVIKADGDYAGDPILLDTAWVLSGSGTATRYTFVFTADSEALRTALGTADSITCTASIEWTHEGVTTRCADFPFGLANSSSRGDDDVAPDPVADASWDWLKARVPESAAVSHDDEERTIAIDVGSSEPDPDLTAHLANTANPHGVTKAQVGLANADNTADTAKPVSAAQQTALDALTTALALKAPLASAALTGTPTAPTASVGTNTTQLATTALVKASIDALVAGAPGALDTLNEIATQLASDESAVSALTTVVSGKEPTQTAASQAEAEAGSETAIRKWSPLRIWQAITAKISSLLASQAEAEAGSDNTKLMTPLRTAQAIAALGGGGSGLVRGSGILSGYTVAPADATTPPDLIITFSATPTTPELISITMGVTTRHWTFAGTDPEDGRIWVDTTGVISAGDMKSLLLGAINAAGLPSLYTADHYDSVSLRLATSASGAEAILTAVTGTVSLQTGGGTGANAIVASGHVVEVELIPAVAGKKIQVVQMGCLGGVGSFNVQIALKYPSENYTSLGSATATAGASQLIVPTDVAAMLAGTPTGVSLVARVTTELSSISIGANAMPWAIAEQS